MKVINYHDVQAKEQSGTLFEGGKVYSQILVASDVAKDMHAGVITFEAGATTVFHIHDFEQILYVISGKARVATEKEEYIVTPGTVVFIPKGERHLHGATKDSPFVQLSIINPGQATELHRE